MQDCQETDRAGRTANDACAAAARLALAPPPLDIEGQLLLSGRIGVKVGEISLERLADHLIPRDFLLVRQ